MTRTSSSPLRDHRYATVYECPDCEQRYLDERRCPDCYLFTRRVGVGGLCPACDEPVATADLLSTEEATMTPT